MISSLLRKLNLRRRNVVQEVHRDTIDRLNRQLVSAQLRADRAEKERDRFMNLYDDARGEVEELAAMRRPHTLRDPITGRYKRKEG